VSERISRACDEKPLDLLAGRDRLWVRYGCLRDNAFSAQRTGARACAQGEFACVCSGTGLEFQDTGVDSVLSATRASAGTTGLRVVVIDGNGNFPIIWPSNRIAVGHRWLSSRASKVTSFANAMRMVQQLFLLAGHNGDFR
jgi:hypothetical protein